MLKLNVILFANYECHINNSNMFHREEDEDDIDLAISTKSQDGGSFNEVTSQARTQGNLKFKNGLYAYVVSLFLFEVSFKGFIRTVQP